MFLKATQFLDIKNEKKNQWMYMKQSYIVTDNFSLQQCLYETDTFKSILQKKGLFCLKSVPY